MSDFDRFSPEALRFLSDLKANNRKDWFAEHKSVYETQIKEPAKQFAQAMEVALAPLAGHAQTAKIYRIHRDVRFSKDKTPYNTHIHLSFAPTNGGPMGPMWFFGLDPDKLSLGCGVFQYTGAGLETFRTQMAGPKGRALLDLTEGLQQAGLRVGPPDLKRVPSGFDKDHPHSEALRRKGVSAWKDMPDPGFATQPGLVSRTVAALRDLEPVYRLLSEIAEG